MLVARTRSTAEWIPRLINGKLIMENKYEFLSKYAVDLNERAASGKLDPVIGRDEEIRRHRYQDSQRTSA